MKSQLKFSLSLANFNPSIFRRNYAKRLSIIKRSSKKEIISRVTDGGEKVSELSKEYGVVSNPIHNFINWKEWAAYLMMDYAEVSCDGGNYLIRKS
jgi:hypothetical protein